jgi:hydroxypyruvate reductase
VDNWRAWLIRQPCGRCCSDVIGDDLDVIGSGPTAPDASTFVRVKGILDKYELWQRVPDRCGSGLKRASGRNSGNAQAGRCGVARTRNLVIGSNDLAVRAAAARARALGFRTLVLSTFVEGETREVARMHAAIAKEIVHSGRPLRAPACIITGGETTVTLKGDGLGGRNQEFVLAAAIDMAGLPNVVILSGGTDGSDGPTDAAGAIADGHTLGRLPAAREFLANNDSYHYFERLGDLLITGPTNTNVMDVRLILAGPAPSGL